jgi:hypothetical protein
MNREGFHQIDRLRRNPWPVHYRISDHHDDGHRNLLRGRRFRQVSAGAVVVRGGDGGRENTDPIDNRSRRCGGSVGHKGRHLKVPGA